MTRSEVLHLHPGDEVFWSDPDKGSECSRTYRIGNIEVLENETDPSGDVVVRIQDVDGDVLEAWASELS